MSIREPSVNDLILNCPQDMKMYLTNRGFKCLENSAWNDFFYTLTDKDNIARIVILLFYLFIWFIFLKYAFRKNLSIWKKILALFLVLVVSFIGFFIVVLFGQIFGFTLIHIF